MRRWQSGQLHQTVNLTDIVLRWFESSPAHEYKNQLKLLLGRFLYSCLYSTKLEPISNREAIDLPRAERVVMRTFYVRIRVRGDANSCPQRLPLVGAPSYRGCTPCGSFAPLRSQNSSQGLAKLQVFASHPRPVSRTSSLFFLAG